LVTWHKFQPVEPSFQRELTAKTKCAIGYKIELTFSFAAHRLALDAVSVL
jgi:hypothetical protein